MTQLLVAPHEQSHRGNNLDALRLCMALLVVWSHSFALYQGTEREEPLSVLLNGTYNAGNIAVMVFFIISGYLISQSYFLSRTLGSFMEKRVRRIYPGYLLATFICAFLIVPAYSSIVNLSVSEVVKTVAGNLFLRNYFPASNAFTTNPVPNVVNGSLWSIPFEFWCYIGLAALGRARLLQERWFIVALLVAVLLGRVCLDVLGKQPGGGLIGLVLGWPYLWFKILPSFLLGMAAYCFRDVIPRSRGILLILSVCAISAPWVSTHLADLIFAPVLAYCTFYVAFSSSIRLNSAATFGDFSYGTYLYAFPIQQMILASCPNRLSLHGFIFLSLILSTSAGVLSWFLVERWFIRRRIKRSRAEAST